MKTHERLLKYVKINTTSDPKSGLHPSTASQKELGKLLVEELKSLDVKDAFMDEHGYVYGTVEANCNDNIPTIGFIAHMDTSSDMSGENIKAQIINNYDGKDVILNKDVIMKVEEFPFLKTLVGRSLITTDGTTLLGADDKAGIAEIMSLVEILKNNPDIKHGKIKIGFTPDEEIGEGALFFDVKGFGCDFAYTLDGGTEGILNYENFNAASCTLTVNGVNIHPGSAKNKMINSILVANEFHSMLPEFMNPAFTENYEGFNHLNEIKGNVEKTTAHYIIRNHDLKKFEKQKQDFIDIQNFLNNKYGYNICNVEVKDSYYNMLLHLKDHMEVVEIAKEATILANVEYGVEPIRGGTDGAVLTYKGLICPNLGTGGYNFHGRYELITIEGMDKAVEIILNIVKLVAKLKR